MKNAQTLECFRKKIELKEALEVMLDGVFPCKFKMLYIYLNVNKINVLNSNKDLGVYIVGSSANGFGTCNSDMDVCLVVSHEQVIYMNLFFYDFNYI